MIKFVWKWHVLILKFWIDSKFVICYKLTIYDGVGDHLKEISTLTDKVMLVSQELVIEYMSNFIVLWCYLQLVRYAVCPNSTFSQYGLVILWSAFVATLQWLERLLCGWLYVIMHELAYYFRRPQYCGSTSSNV